MDFNLTNPWYRGYLDGYYFGSCLITKPTLETAKTIEEWKKGFKRGEEDFCLELQPIT